MLLPAHEGERRAPKRQMTRGAARRPMVCPRDQPKTAPRIVPRLQRVYEWSAEELREPRLLELVRDGNPIYAWPFEKRHVWRSADMPLAGRILERATRAR